MGSFEIRGNDIMSESKCLWCGKIIDNTKWRCPNCGCEIKETRKARKEGDITWLCSIVEGKLFRFRIEGKKLLAVYNGNSGVNTPRTLEIPSGIEIIGKSAFANCDEANYFLQAIKIPKSVKIVEEGAFACFQGWFAVEEACQGVKLVDGILYSGDGKMLLKASNEIVGKDVVLPEGVEKIGKRAFHGLKPKNIKLPNTLKVIGEDAFSAIRFDTIELPELLEVIEKDAFSSSELKEIYLPKNLRKIGQTALGYALEKIKISEENNYFKVIDGVLFSKSGKRLILVERVKTGDYEIPKEVTSVDLGAFARLNLSVLTVYPHVKFHELDKFDFLGGKECEKVIK
jgi:predicted RNA-binding Zn-ribbon protein involved in translation (DUF1610 family)